MSIDANAALAAADRDRRRHLATLLANPYDQSFGGMSTMPGWSAFFGSLQDKADEAAANGMRYRTDFGSLADGLPVNGGAFTQAPGGVQYPSDVGSVAKNQALSQMADQNRARKMGETAAAIGLQEDAAAGLKRGYEENTIASAGVGVDLGTPEGQKTFLSRLPPPLRLPLQEHFAGLDLAQRKQAESEKATDEQIRASQGKMALEQDKFKATYGAGMDENGQPIASPVAKQIAEYRIPAVSPARQQTPEGMALMAQVARLNPSYDATQFPARNKMRIAFSSGPQSQTLNSLNTAIVHLDQFAELAKGLDNGSFQASNAVKNWIKTEFGDSAPTNFDGMKTILSGELASAFKKSGATDEEIASVKSAIANRQSPAQLTDYVTKIAIPALGGKAGTFQDQWRQVMGATDPFSVYTPSAKTALEKYGAHVGAAPSSGIGGTVKLMAPDGTMRDVSADQVEHYLSLGAKRVGG